VDLAGGRAGEERCAESAPSGVGQDSLSEERPSCLGDMLGLIADHQSRRTIAEIGIHSTEPGTNRVVVLLSAQKFHDLQRVLQGRRGLRAWHVLPAGPTPDSLRIPGAGDGRHKSLPEQVLKRGRGGAEWLASDPRMNEALEVGDAFGHLSSALGDYHKTTQKANQ
jgi:hypothetical protein